MLCVNKVDIVALKCSEVNIKKYLRKGMLHFYLQQLTDRFIKVLIYNLYMFFLFVPC